MKRTTIPSTCCSPEVTWVTLRRHPPFVGDRGTAGPRGRFPVLNHHQPFDPSMNPASTSPTPGPLQPNTPSPSGRGQAACLRGFAPHQAEFAAQWLTQHGFRVVRSLEAAQVVVAGPEAEKSLVDLSQSRGVRLVRWEDLQSRCQSPPPGDPQGGAQAAGGSAPAPVLPLIEALDDHRVRILGVELAMARPLPADGKLVPAAGRFDHICLDQPFADTLGAVLLGASKRYPVALEGETAASKTSAVLWLAQRLGQPVVRLNLNGQTDAGELVGKHVPADAMGGVAMADLATHAELLDPATRRILEKAAAEGRGLSALERALVARTERLPTVQWRFDESCLPRAMRKGWWLLLDEMNLAEPQILERLNSALESPPTLVLSEGDGTVFGPGGDVEVHERFRLFATLNPAEYSGRSVLSPAFRDRWSVWHHPQTPGEAEVHAMLHFLVFGIHPVVQVAGRAYQAPPAPRAPFEGWQRFAGVEGLLDRLATFHASAARAASGAGAGGLARHQRERATFTRRSLLSLMSHVAAMAEAAGPAADGAALVRSAIAVFYSGRLRDAGDRKALATMLRATGLA